MMVAVPPHVEDEQVAEAGAVPTVMPAQRFEVAATVFTLQPVMRHIIEQFEHQNGDGAFRSQENCRAPFPAKNQSSVQCSKDCRVLDYPIAGRQIRLGTTPAAFETPGVCNL